MVRRRWLVIVLWAVAVGTGALCSARLPALLSTSLAVPGTASQQADVLLAEHFGGDVEGTFTVVLPFGGDRGNGLAELDRRFAAAARTLPGGEASPLQKGAGIVYGDINSSLDLAQAARFTPELRRELKADGLAGAYVTGAPALQYDITPVLSHDLHLGELAAIGCALVMLLLALGVSAAVLVPFVVALCTTSATLALVFALAHMFLMVLYVPNVVELIGLGLAVDYSLLIVHRARQEMGRAEVGLDEAVVRTMSTAGRTVAVSGLVVAVGLALLLAIPVPFMRSLGLAGLLVPLVSVLAAFTLQPALLSVLGLRGLSRLRPGSTPAKDRRRRPVGWWRETAVAVTRRPLAAVAGSGALLALAAVPVAWLQLTPASLTAVPKTMQSAQGLEILRARAGPGVATPMEIVLDSGARGGAISSANDAATLRLADELLRQADVYVVAIGTRPPYVDSSGRYRRTVVVERDEFGGPASQQLVRLVRSRLVPEARFPPASRVYVGGAPAQGADFLATVYGHFIWLVPIIALVAYLMLLRAFRSVLLPLVAVFLDGVSTTASYGVVVVVFHFGAAPPVGLYHVGQVEGWVPVFLFAMLFGLSMDYQVFFVSRMREAWDNGTGSRAAIVEGLERTGRVVTVAALIMVGALSGLAFGDVAGLQELGVGLAIGVLLDALVVRGLLMPGLMTLFGPWNWWLPEAVAHLVRVQASPLTARGEA